MMEIIFSSIANGVEYFIQSLKGRSKTANQEVVDRGQ